MSISTANLRPLVHLGIIAGTIVTQRGVAAAPDIRDRLSQLVALVKAKEVDGSIRELLVFGTTATRREAATALQLLLKRTGVPAWDGREWDKIHGLLKALL